MKNYLFPGRFRLIGWMLFVPAVILGVLILAGVCQFHGVVETVMNDAAIIGVAIGAVFIVCSKEKREDEMTRSIRLAALLNSLYIYVALLISSTLFINGMAYLNYALVNLVLLPIIYVVTFRLEMQRYNKMAEDEEQD